MEDTIKHWGKHHVVNGDELFAKQVEHPSSSWGIVNEQNIVTSNVNKKNGITTTPLSVLLVMCCLDRL